MSLYTSRIMPNGREYGGVYVIQGRGFTHYERQYPTFKEPLTKYFVHGKGWYKVGKSKVTLVPSIPKCSVSTYSDVFSLIQAHGVEVTLLLMGFDEQSIGDRDPVRQLRMLAKYREPMLKWLEKIAEIDGGIKAFFESKGISFRKAETTDIWLNKGDGDDYDCMYRTSPFIGQHIAVSLRGILILANPHIDVVALDKDWELTLKFAGVPTDTSMVELLTMMVGDELAQWMLNNLSPEFN